MNKLSFSYTILEVTNFLYSVRQSKIKVFCKGTVFPSDLKVNTNCYADCVGIVN